MAISGLNLPVDVPWKLIAVSPDMMDTQFGNKKFPFSWRSSLAISAYEPVPEELPEELCEERLTFLKVTASITGYQPTKEETDRAYVEYPEVPTEDLDRILSEYFACYGVLLNVAVFPHGTFKKRRERRNVDFGQLQPPTQTLPNPYQNGQFAFRAIGQANNRTVDRYPQRGDQRGELDLFKEMVVTFPATSRVEAKVASSANPANPVTMEAYRGTELIGSQAAGREAWRVYELAIEGEGIDRVVFRTPEGNASLLEFAFLEDVEETPTLDDYPHIIDFEPKARDLYQLAAENGEILTASKSGINTSKSLTHTESSQTGLSLSAKYESPPSPYGNASVTGGLSHSWGETDQDTSAVATDASRERRERHATTTSLSQMYNLLTGYHPGTNRATLFMLPRPHVLQATDRRTFAQGLRMIEGVQEFFLIVNRPRGMEGLSVEAFLETAHFPEKVEVERTPAEYDEYDEEMRVFARGKSCLIGDCEQVNYDVSRTPTAGYIVDRRKGNPEHRGLTLIRDNTHSGTAQSQFHSINFDIADDHARVHGWVKGKSEPNAFGGWLDKTFTVHYRSEEPRQTSDPIVKTRLLITSRGLKASFKSGEKCIEIVPSASAVSLADDSLNEVAESIVDELAVKLDSAEVVVQDANGQPGTSTAKEALRQIQTAMSTSGRLRRRRPYGAVGFLESNYFQDEIKPYLPDEGPVIG